MSTKTHLPTGWTRDGARVQAPPRAEESPPGDEENKPAAAEATCPKCGAPVDAGDKFCRACGAELGAPPSDDEPSPAAARAFATWARKETGERNVDAARGAIVAWREAAARTDAAELRLGVLERERVLEAAVAEGRLEPAEAWAFGVNEQGEKVRAFSEWSGPPNAEKGTGQSLEQLRAYVARRPSKAGAQRPVTPRTPAGGLGEVGAHAQRTGRDPARYAEIENIIRNKQTVAVEVES